MQDKAVVFVAYSSTDSALSETIVDSVRHVNALPIPVRYEPWLFNDVPGNPLISPILEKIDDSPFVVADITYLNPNVVYEIGFAIGRRKRAFLVRHADIPGDKTIAKVVGVFDTLGYHEYEDANKLRERLAAHIEPSPPVFHITVNQKSPAYLIEPPHRGRRRRRHGFLRQKGRLRPLSELCARRRQPFVSHRRNSPSRAVLRSISTPATALGAECLNTQYPMHVSRGSRGRHGKAEARPFPYWS